MTWRTIKATLLGMRGCWSPDPAVQRQRRQRIRRALGYPAGDKTAEQLKPPPADWIQPAKGT